MGLSRDQRTGLVCRTKRVLAMEAEILSRTSAYFARANPIVAYRRHAVASWHCSRVVGVGHYPSAPPSARTKKTPWTAVGVLSHAGHE